MIHGERGQEIKKNAMRWKELAKETVDEGGSCDENIYILMKLLFLAFVVVLHFDFQLGFVRSAFFFTMYVNSSFLV